MATTLRPLLDNVIVKPLDEASTTSSGIIIPDTISKEKPKRGEVIAIGDGKISDGGQKIESPVKVGDIVYFTQYAPTEIKIDGEEFYLISFVSLLAVEEK